MAVIAAPVTGVWCWSEEPCSASWRRCPPCCSHSGPLSWGRCCCPGCWPAPCPGTGGASRPATETAAPGEGTHVWRRERAMRRMRTHPGRPANNTRRVEPVWSPDPPPLGGKKKTCKIKRWQKAGARVGEGGSEVRRITIQTQRCQIGFLCWIYHIIKKWMSCCHCYYYILPYRLLHNVSLSVCNPSKDNPLFCLGNIID